MNKKTIKDIDIKGKRVLIRVDFNVPLDDKLNITDDTRIRAAIPTIKYAMERASKVILMSHLGRPDGKVVDKLRLTPIAKRLKEIMGADVTKLDECIGDAVTKAVSDPKTKGVILLENLRFHAEEEANDVTFAKELASLADIYVNDAFGTAHRAHASTEGVAKYLPAVAGFLLDKEIKYLSGALEHPAKPFVAILGGSKVSDKIGVVDNIIDKVDAIIIGGAMAYTFLKVQGVDIGSSKFEKDKTDLAKQLLDKAKAKKVNILLPIDHIIADKVGESANTKIQEGDIPQGWFGVDIGPASVKKFKELLSSAKTIVWNGPLGVFEIDKFSHGTEDIARFITTTKATTIIGGGDTAAAVAKFGLEDKMSHVSTGGGASLEFLEGRVLPGIAALQDAGVQACHCGAPKK